MIDTIIEGKDVIGFSPWGKIDLATRCTKGIWFVSTPSHGGFWLSKDRQIEYGGQPRCGPAVALERSKVEPVLYNILSDHLTWRDQHPTTIH